MAFRPLQIEQRDKDRRGTRPAPPNDIRHELCEATILVMLPVREFKEAGTSLFGRSESESLSSHVRSRVNDVICAPEVSRVL